ncbi:MAG: hypothetical protein ACKV0T_12760 [Planctomycetales bacterium]
MDTASEHRPIHPLELLSLLVAAALIGGCFWLAPQPPPYWIDEVFTAVAVEDPSLGHMLNALRDEINALPPLYFILGWLWAKCFGASEMSMRTPSVIGGIVAIVGLWWGLRRLTSRRVAVACAICVPLMNQEFREHLFEARCYTLYFAAFVWAWALYVRTGDGELSRRRLDWRVFLVHLLLVAVHYVGGLFSALLVASAWLTAKIQGDQRYRRYAWSAVASWAGVLPSLPFYLAQRKLAGEFNWVPRPPVKLLLTEFITTIDGLPLILALLGTAWLFLEVVGKKCDTKEPAGSRQQLPQLRPVAIFIGLLILFIPAIWFESRLAARLFLPRYLFLTMVGWITLVALVIDSVWHGILGFSRGPATGAPRDGGALARVYETGVIWSARWLCWTVVGIMGVFALWGLHRMRQVSEHHMNRSWRLRDTLNVVNQYPDLPVITVGIQEFGCLRYYTGSPARVFLNADPTCPLQRNFPSIVRYSFALERHYYPDSVVTDLPKLINEQDRFLVVAYPAQLPESGFFANPEGWTSTKLKPNLYLWERQTATPKSNQ